MNLLVNVRPSKIHVREDLTKKGPLIQADVLGQL
jgi:hypothetical protein